MATATSGPKPTRSRKSNVQTQASTPGALVAGDNATGASGDAPVATDRLAAVLEQFGGATGYRVYVERLDQADGPEYLGALTLDSDLYQRVRDKWGGGRFGGRIVNASSTYVGRVPPFRIAGKPRDDSNDPPTSIARGAGSEQPESLAAIVAAALAPFADELRQQRELLAQRTAAPAESPITTAVAILKAVREATPAPAPPADMAQMFASMNGFLEMQDRLRGDGAGGSGVAGAIREAMPVLSKLIDHRGDSPANQSPSDMNRSLAPSSSGTPAPATPAPAVAAWIRPFMRWRSTLLQLADSGRDPALYADVLTDNLTDEHADLILAADAAGELERDLFAAVPELNSSETRRVFAGSLLAQIRGALHDDETSGATNG